MQQNKKNSADYVIFSGGFSGRLRKLRSEKNLSMADMAKKIGLSSSSQISRYESGENLPDIYTLFVLHEILEVDLHWLITGENYDPQKRLVAQFKETYEKLHQEYEAAQAIVNKLESRQPPLTDEEQQQLIQNRGRMKIAVRQMENFVELTQQQKKI